MSLRRVGVHEEWKTYNRKEKEGRRRTGKCEKGMGRKEVFVPASLLPSLPVTNHATRTERGVEAGEGKGEVVELSSGRQAGKGIIFALASPPPSSFPK